MLEDAERMDVVLEPYSQGGRAPEQEFRYGLLDLATCESPSTSLCGGASPPNASCRHAKLTVVLDIDETLVHAEELKNGDEEVSQSLPANSFVLVVGRSKLCIRKRPFLDEFLREASRRFNLVAFTAGSESYAKPLLNVLDPEKKYFQRHLYRHDCAFKYGSDYVKDLRVLNVGIERLVLVDNNPFSFLLQLNNGVPIAPFIQDEQDKALVTLFDFLVSLESHSDVREPLRSIFGLEHVFKNLPMEKLESLERKASRQD